MPSELNAGRQSLGEEAQWQKEGSGGSQPWSELAGDLGPSLLAPLNQLTPLGGSGSSELALEDGSYGGPSQTPSICVCQGLDGWSMMLFGEPRRIQEEGMEWGWG